MLFIRNVGRKKRLVILNNHSLFNALFFLSSSDAVPAGFDGLCDQGLVQNDKTQDMIPREGNQGVSFIVASPAGNYDPARG